MDSGFCNASQEQKSAAPRVYIESNERGGDLRDLRIILQFACQLARRQVPEFVGEAEADSAFFWMAEPKMLLPLVAQAHRSAIMGKTTGVLIGPKIATGDAMAIERILSAWPRNVVLLAKAQSPREAFPKFMDCVDAELEKKHRPAAA
jgi:hypothetical protein